jgi:hypothetical protein
MYKMPEKFKNAALTIYTRKTQEKIKYEDSKKERSKYSVLIFCHFNFQRTIYTIHMLRKNEKSIYIKSSRNVLFKCEQKLYLN